MEPRHRGQLAAPIEREETRDLGFWVVRRVGRAWGGKLAGSQAGPSAEEAKRGDVATTLGRAERASTEETGRLRQEDCAAKRRGTARGRGDRPVFQLVARVAQARAPDRSGKVG
jgi:hypothetical protein